MDGHRLRDATLVLEGTMERPELAALPCGQVALYSARSPEKASPNEDAAAILPIDDRSAVLAVADGLGGPVAGEHAARIAIETLHGCLAERAGDEVQLRTVIIDAFEQANRAVLELGVGAATTLAVVEIQDRTVRPYHVGDSMILVMGQRGKVKLQTLSHSPVAYAVEAGVLDAEAAMHHEDRHLVSNVIGQPEMRIEVGPARKLAARDTVLLASDGLFDNLRLKEIVDRLRKGPLERGALRLAEDARRRMAEPEEGQPSKPDDLTLIAFRLPPAARRASAAPPAPDA